MWNSLKSYFKLLKLARIILGSFLTFLGILLVMKIIFPLLGQLTFSKTGFHVDSYYSVIAITLVCLFPLIIGLLYEYIPGEIQSSDLPATSPGLKSLLLLRMFFAALICFVFVLLTVLLVKPVPTEGWLRNLFASCIISIQVPFVCAMRSALMKKKVKGFYIFIFCIILLITIPFGMLVHHPWNYFVFFSPLYWLSWTWIIGSPVESLVYGTISVIITSTATVIFLKSLLKMKIV